MATSLPTDIDATYSDDGAAARKLHQQYHDALHDYANTHDGAADPHSVYLLKTAASAAYVAKAGVDAQRIATEQSTNSGAWVDLASVGPTVQVNVPASGRVLVALAAGAYSSANGDFYMAFAVSGANTRTPDSAEGLRWSTTGATIEQRRYGVTTLLTGLAPGLTTFTAKYVTGGGITASFNQRELVVIPL